MAAPSGPLCIDRDDLAVAVERVVAVTDAVQHGAQEIVRPLQFLDQCGQEDRRDREHCDDSEEHRERRAVITASCRGGQQMREVRGARSRLRPR